MECVDRTISLGVLENGKTQEKPVNSETQIWGLEKALFTRENNEKWLNRKEKSLLTRTDCS